MAIEAARLTVVVDAATDAAERGLDRVGERVNNAGGMIRTAAGTAFGFLAAEAVQGAARAGGAMLAVGIDTERALNIFQSVTQATGDTMARVSSLARELGNDVTLPGTSAKDASLAMVELAKGGLNVEQSMAAAKGTLQLAAAAGTDAGTAAQITANALNAFGLSGDKAGKVADLLAGAANASSGEITDMAYAMQMSSAVFKMGNQSIESLTASIGLMANKGILGSDAGTSLKTMMLSLQAPTGKANALLKDMGISVRDSSGHMRPMRDLIEQFTKATKGMGDAERDKALKTIFGTDAIRAANIVMTGGVEAYDAMTAAVTRQGAAQSVAEARMKGVGGALEGLKSQVETVLIDAFNAAAPTMERVLRALSDGFPVAIGMLGDAFGRLRSHISMGIEAFRNFRLTGEWESHSLAESIGVAFARAVAWFQENWPRIREVVSEVMDGVRVAIGAVVDFVAAHWPEISRIIGEVLDTARVIVGTALEAIAAFWRTWGGTVTRVVEDAFNAIRQIIDGALNIIRGVINVVMGLVRGDWSRVWEGIREILSGVWTVINGLVDQAINTLRTIIEVGMRLVAGVFDNIWEGIKSAASAAWGGIRDTVRDAADRVWDTIAAIPGRIGGLAYAFATSAASLGKAIVDGIVSGISGLASGAMEFGQAFGNAVVDVVNEHIIDRINSLLAFKISVPLGPDINVDPPDIPRIPRFHTGGIVPGVGDVLAVLKGGEAVFTPDQMRVLGQVMGGGSSSTSSATTVNFNGPVNASRRSLDRITAAVVSAKARDQVGRRVAIDARGVAR